MSTSNHKPFTFPKGIPSVPEEGGGREAGIRYADYALGQFFNAVKTKPYFENTLFVIVGDHGARVYGKQEIPLQSYEIPLLIYAPKYVVPQTVDIITSQIDIAPTILGMLNISYDSVFFGKDVFHTTKDPKYVLVSHNRDVALFDNVELNELGIQKSQATFLYDKPTHHQKRIADDPKELKTAIGIYQEAYNLFMNKQYHL